MIDAICTWFTEHPRVVESLIAIAKTLVILVTVMLTMAWTTWLERRMLGVWQDRYGPNRVGPFGLGQVLADMVKALFKEDWTPPFVDKFTYVMAPMLGMGLTLLMFMVIPIAPGWGIADLNVGLLVFLALAGLEVYAVMLGGWSSNSKYSLLGGVRVTAQTVSYEVFMGLSLMGIVMQAGSFDLRTIVDAQAGLWNIVPQFLGFCTFAIAGIAVVHRAPFDLPEAESELAQGFHTEYSSMKFAMFMLSEYIGVVLISAVLVTLFFGGWRGPFIDDYPLLGLLYFAMKTFFFMLVFILLRASLPRPRYDQLMSFGWKICLPLTLINLLGTAAVLLWQSQGA